MKLLLKSVKVVDPNSPHHGKQVDILVQNGTIAKIGKSIKEEGIRKLEWKGAHVSPGWLDLNVNFCDPGHEPKEDLKSGADAAAAGGFTAVALMPNTQPPLHSKSEIEYIRNKAQAYLVDVWPLGTISRDKEGKDLSEMYDMKSSGAVAFTDGTQAVQDAGLMSRALLYAKGIGSLVMNTGDDRSISQKGKMNEGEMSTLLGVKGIPALAEELMIARDIYLAEYNDARIHFSNISSARSVDLIRAAKRKGLKITCDVSVNNLYFDESALHDFDSNFKLRPPLRTSQDIKSLKNGLKDGTIDAICSQHTPEDKEHKEVEFEIAAYGSIGLQTAFALACMSLQKSMEIESIISCLSQKPRAILGLEPVSIREGAKANLTVFDPEKEWSLAASDILSKSKNTPLIGARLNGKALAVINNDQYKLTS